MEIVKSIPHPDSEGLNEGLADINEGLSEGLKAVLGIINNNPGIQAKKIAELLNNRPIKTVDRQIKTLVEKGLVDRRGSLKQVVISKHKHQVRSSLLFSHFLIRYFHSSPIPLLISSRPLDSIPPTTILILFDHFLFYL